MLHWLQQFRIKINWILNLRWHSFCTWTHFPKFTFIRYCHLIPFARCWHSETSNHEASIQWVHMLKRITYWMWCQKDSHHKIENSRIEIDLSPHSTQLTELNNSTFSLYICIDSFSKIKRKHSFNACIARSNFALNRIKSGTIWFS